MSREKTFVANWKMNKASGEVQTFLKKLSQQIGARRAYIAPSFTQVSLAASLANSQITIGAQNMSEHAKGAYTGEVSLDMLKGAGAEFVILGHSERRHIYGESDEVIRKKVELAQRECFSFIICIGETIEERKGGQMEQVLKRQIASALQGIEGLSPDQLMLAYEPVWAIGTGEAATPEMANSAQEYCRHLIEEMIGKNFSDSLRILYGGSVKPGNAAELLDQPHIDGFLIGGASLEADSFAQIINCKRN